MKYIVIFVVVLGLGGVWYWWNLPEQNLPQEKIPIVDVIENTQSTSTVETSENNLYQNDEWGISFEYPLDWTARESDIDANSSLFNVVLQPDDADALPRPIYILFSSDEWGKSLVEKYYTLESGSRQIVSGIDAYIFKSSDMGMQTKVHVLPINETYWVNVVGKTGYEKELDQVLESLTITPVEIESKN